jgi:hypothetical protein
VALVALFDSKKVYVSGSEGGVIPCGDFPWRWTLCAWSLAYKNAQILVIPDTLQDVRFRENAKVGPRGVACGEGAVRSSGSTAPSFPRPPHPPRPPRALASRSRATPRSYYICI